MPSFRTPKSLTVLVEFIQLASSSVTRSSQTRIKNQYGPKIPLKKKRRLHDHILKEAARQQEIYQRMSWRDYQKALNQTQNSHKHLKRIFLGTVIALIAAGIIYTLLPPLIRNAPLEPDQSVKLSAKIADHTEQLPQESNKIDIQAILDDQKLLNLTKENFEIVYNQQHYLVETSLDPVLQNTLIKRFDKVNSRYIGIVAMNPDTGRILAFTGFNKTQLDLNPCTTNKFPAASLFKIVTAAAAAEKLGYSENTLLKFNGQKHTLYKSQLKDRENRYTNRISFRNSFAQSINPVFGKIGALRLGKEALQKYGEYFGFNRNFNTEIDIAPSHLNVTEDAYHHAEIASGFNRNTTLSPVHAAMIVTTMLNGGKMIEPTIIDRIINESGQTIYNGSYAARNQVISSRTSEMIQGMMEATVRSGTARKTFRGYTRDKVLKKLMIGGKTGSIFNKAHNVRFDWFVGFAKTKDLSEKIVISALVAHEEYIGRRAGEYARIAFKTHFKNYFAKKESRQYIEKKS
jgi:cell division protein FtsI/penicillin-binding protein 2